MIHLAMFAGTAVSGIWCSLTQEVTRPDSLYVLWSAAFCWHGSTSAMVTMHLQRKNTRHIGLLQGQSIKHVALHNAVLMMGRRCRWWPSFNSYSAGIDFRHQNLTSVDVRF